MAKRQKAKAQNEPSQTLLARRELYLKILLLFMVALAILYGFLQGYPIVAEGQTVRGLLIGFGYGGAALLAMVGAFFINQKLRKM